MIRCVMEIEVISENNITITAFQEIFLFRTGVGTI